MSVLAFTDGKRVLPLLAAQDHKRAADGDMGPNTGGMGAYAPAPVIETIGIEWVTEHILQPTIDGMAEAGCSYKGVLYAGLMLTPQGPKVLEYNVRFGDPETQPCLLYTSKHRLWKNNGLSKYIFPTRSWRAAGAFG